MIKTRDVRYYYGYSHEDMKAARDASFMYGYITGGLIFGTLAAMIFHFGGF